MTLFWTLLVCAIGMTLAQDAVPGRAIYHAGWYNALAIALAVLAGRGLRKRTLRERFAFAGAALVTIAGAASGLLGPDTQLVIGAPGATIDTRDYGSVAFPLDAHAVPARRYTLWAIFSAQAREVVHVTVSDAGGNHLTVTQPSNATFLSPVLMMQQTARVANMDVLTDEFAVPAVSRAVKAVLFSASQAALLRRAETFAGKPAVLFDVTDAKGRTLPGGLGLVPSGERKTIAGLTFGADVQPYPALEAASAPFLPLLAVGLVLFAFGAFKSRFR